MDCLFVRLMEWGKEHGYARFSLGMAPLAGLEERPSAPVWNRIALLVLRHGEHFYNFQGLRQYKAKFSPEWRARYIAAPGGLALPGVLADISTRISGGVRATFRP
jgi:phosphatidylglycerol lysyltransferase